MTRSSKPSPRELEREAQRLVRLRRGGSAEPRVVDFQATRALRDRASWEDEPDPKEAA